MHSQQLSWQKDGALSPISQAVAPRHRWVQKQAKRKALGFRYQVLFKYWSGRFRFCAGRPSEPHFL